MATLRETLSVRCGFTQVELSPVPGSGRHSLGTAAGLGTSRERSFAARGVAQCRFAVLCVGETVRIVLQLALKAHVRRNTYLAQHSDCDCVSNPPLLFPSPLAK